VGQGTVVLTSIDFPILYLDDTEYFFTDYLIDILSGIFSDILTDYLTDYLTDIFSDNPTTMAVSNRRIHTLVFLAAAALLLGTSCRSTELAYVSDARRDTAQQILGHYDQLILPGDQLYIHVASMAPQSVVPFNQETRGIVVEGSELQYLDTTHSAQASSEGNIRSEQRRVTVEVSGYNVADDGTILFPVLGRLSVAGITQDSLRRQIEQRLQQGGYVSDPQVTSRLMNFRVAVVGEVRQPQQIHVDGTRLTILEAIAICGDLTDDARRDNVTIVRQEDGRQTLAEIDLTHSAFLDSPYYYLRQNDIVYVEPRDLKRRRADRNDDIPRYVAIGVNVWSIIRASIRNARVQQNH